RRHGAPSLRLLGSGRALTRQEPGARPTRQQGGLRELLRFWQRPHPGQGGQEVLTVPFSWPI
ncbi:MAG TPA: hypothetical protein VJ180_12665, partial [Pyrinomonadaceae bacterium]|nr:hypothetical protein [Pyrinomonadaceae bacterium]